MLLASVQYGTVQYSTVRYSTVQYGTVWYGTVRYVTVRYGTVQYSTVVEGSLHCRFIKFHLLDVCLIGFSSLPAFSIIFHHFDIKNFHDGKYLCQFLGSGAGVLRCIEEKMGSPSIYQRMKS